ncbi:C2H2-type domain-containing protein [Entamoeba marina]
MKRNNYTIDKGGRRKWDKELYVTEYFEGQWSGEDNSIKVTREESLKQLQQLKEHKSNVLTKKGTGLFCNVCNKTFKDSSSFLEHINSPEHNEKAGIESVHKVATETPEERKQREDAFRASRKQRKKEWKTKQKELNNNDDDGSDSDSVD